MQNSQGKGSGYVETVTEYVESTSGCVEFVSKYVELAFRDVESTNWS